LGGLKFNFLPLSPLIFHKLKEIKTKKEETKNKKEEEHKKGNKK